MNHIKRTDTFNIRWFDYVTFTLLFDKNNENNPKHYPLRSFLIYFKQLYPKKKLMKTSVLDYEGGIIKLNSFHYLSYFYRLKLQFKQNSFFFFFNLAVWLFWWNTGSLRSIHFTIFLDNTFAFWTVEPEASPVMSSNLSTEY